MVDVLTPAQRRLNMSRIKGANTKPEKLLRSALHATGLRFRLHRRDLPGRPDIVFVRQNTVVFVHGCFWHDHGCSYSKLPATREAFWKAKLAGNKQRDQRALHALRKAGWRVIVVWECALRGAARPSIAEICARVDKFLKRLGNDILEIRGVHIGDALEPKIGSTPRRTRQACRTQRSPTDARARSSSSKRQTFP